MLAGAMTAAIAGTLPHALQAQPPTQARPQQSIDAIALLTSKVMGIQGQVAGLRVKLDRIEAATVDSVRTAKPGTRAEGVFGERCCTGEVAALRWALTSLRADVATMRRIYEKSKHLEGLRRLGQVDAQLHRFGEALTTLANAADMPLARAETTHLAAAAEAMRGTIADGAVCCTIRISPEPRNPMSQEDR